MSPWKVFERAVAPTILVLVIAACDNNRALVGAPGTRVDMRTRVDTSAETGIGETGIGEMGTGEDASPRDDTGWDCRHPVTAAPCVLGQGDSCICQRSRPGDDLPLGGDNWRCHRVNKGGKLLWICYGEVASGGVAPAGSTWGCEKMSSSKGLEQWKCTHVDGPDDTPSEGSYFMCVKGTAFNGTQCQEVEKQQDPWGTLYPRPGDTCTPGTRFWCSGLQYDGWGQATCKPDGTWETTIINGKIHLACTATPSGLRPNTLCACYHAYYNPACCERPDCIIPQGSPGQICPKSTGALCDYCNPQKPECAEAGALCVVTNTMESFCGRSCENDDDCPVDYRCLDIPHKSSRQCVPKDFSCYY